MKEVSHLSIFLLLFSHCTVVLVLFILNPIRETKKLPIGIAEY